MERFQFTKHISILDFCLKYDSNKAKPIAQKFDSWTAVPDENGDVHPSILRVLTVGHVYSIPDEVFFEEEHVQKGHHRHETEKTNVRHVSLRVARDIFSEYEQLVPAEETHLFTEVKELK